MTDSLREELSTLRQEKASIQWVKESTRHIENDIAELKTGLIEAKTHHCLKEDTLRRMEEILKDVPKEFGSWKFFRIIFISVFSTLLIFAVTAIVAFSNVRADTETSKQKLKKHSEKIEKLEDQKINELTQIQTSLKLIEEEIRKR